MPENLDPLSTSPQQQEVLETLQQKYDALQLPNSYDYLLTQEKLALEIRRQNKELKNQSEILRETKNELAIIKDQCEILESQLEELRRSQEPCGWIKQLQQMLMQALDALLNQSYAARETTQIVLDMMPPSGWVQKLWKPSKTPQIKQILDGYCMGVDTIHDKLLSWLADLEIELIAPQLGDPFVPHLHRAVEQLSGGTSKTIAKVIRYGYTTKEELLRYADVAVYR